MTDDALTSRANVVLHLDNGAEMQFSGRPFAGGSWFDDETGEKRDTLTLIKMKL